MTDILYLQVNIVGMIILYIMLINQQNIDNGTNRQKAFRYLNYSVFVILILDSCMWLIDGNQFPYAHQIYWAVTSFYYFFNCGIAFIWYIYISKFFYQNHRESKKKLFFVMSIPIILNTLLIMLNLKYPIYFTIGENNVYDRASFFVVSFLVALPYLGVPLLQCLRVYRTTDNILERKDAALIMKIHILPIIGIIIQILIYGISLIWICQVLSLLCFFINFQNKIISMDPLTHLNNRYQYNVCMQSIGRGTLGGINAIIFIDIDKFKGINDRFGHVFGDKVLVAVASILMKACEGQETIVGRFGGDEFYIFCKVSAKEEIIERMHSFVAVYNEMDRLGVGLSLSIGSSDFEGKETRKTEDIVELADQAMYKNKVK